MLPDKLYVRDEPGNEDDVELALAEELVGDVDVAGLRVLGLGSVQRCWLPLDRGYLPLDRGGSGNTRSASAPAGRASMSGRRSRGYMSSATLGAIT